MESSAALSDRQKLRLRRNLGKRLTKDGVLVLAASEYRSQTRNREAVLTRFRELVSEAMKVPRARKATKPSAAAKTRRLEEKRRTSEKKALRKSPDTP